MSSRRFTPSQEEILIEGIAVSPGIAHAAVTMVGKRFEAPEAYDIPDDEIEGEMMRFEQALLATRDQILEMQKRIATSAGGHDASIFDAHLLVLEDRAVLDRVMKQLVEQKKNIESVFYGVLQQYIESMRRIDDTYLRERVIDVEDICHRVIRNLLGTEEAHQATFSGGKMILVAHELTPSDTAAVDANVVVAFATETGGETSHASIMARSLGIPAVVGLRDICEELEPGDDILLDGYDGLVIRNPSPATLERYGKIAEEKARVTARLAELSDTKCATADGHEVTLSGNIEFAHEIDQIRESGAEGVGLYRTEFFYLNKATFPTEDEQAANYRKVAEAVNPAAVIIRTLDIGGDKLYPELHGSEEQNPFLGWRGIRVSLEERELFKTQLRAILRASHYGKTGVLYPMASGVGEVRAANAMLEECREELRTSGVPFDEKMEVGAMIELPGAAMVAEFIAPEVDFFSIGTNDLVQYTLAVDRGNERVAALYQPTHPGVIRLIDRTVKAAHEHGIWIGICGEMAGDIVLAPFLVGVGLDEFSVGSGESPRVKYAVQHLDRERCRELVAELLLLGDAEGVRARCQAMAEECYPELLR